MSAVGQLKEQIKHEEDAIETILTNAILEEFCEEGVGKRKRKKNT
tara:strand:+ start:1519 stop:1653 length:135 start_codon:yes stop_codon:yes gene_type:complete